MQQPTAISIDQQHAVELKVREIVANAIQVDLDKVQLTTSLSESLGAESLDFLDIAFLLEREFRVQFPRTDILERAARYFGEDALVKQGMVTDFGLDLLRKGMPEVPPDHIHHGMLAIDVMRTITVETFVRITMRLLEAKAQFPRTCPVCGATTVESDVMPEFVCPKCGNVRPLPSGDDILLEDLIALADNKQAAESA